MRRCARLPLRPPPSATRWRSDRRMRRHSPPNAAADGEHPPTILRRTTSDRITGFTISGLGANGIFPVAADRLRIDHNTLGANGEYGAFGNTSARTRLDHNVAKGNRGEASLYVGDSPRAEAVVTRHRLLDNHGEGRLLRSASHGRVSRNVSTGNCIGDRRPRRRSWSRRALDDQPQLDSAKQQGLHGQPRGGLADTFGYRSGARRGGPHEGDPHHDQRQPKAAHDRVLGRRRHPPGRVREERHKADPRGDRPEPRGAKPARSHRLAPGRRRELLAQPVSDL